MTDSQLQAWLDKEDEHVAQPIRKCGLFIQLVSSDPGDLPPAFAYTVGLFGLGHPELVVLSMDTGSAGGLLNHLGDRIRAGDNLMPGSLLSFDEWPRRVTVEELPNPGDPAVGRPSLSATARGVCAGVPADLRRQAGPVPVGSRLFQLTGPPGPTRDLASLISSGSALRLVDVGRWPDGHR